MPTCTTNGIDINYVRRGSGPRLLAFGGTGMNVESFAPLVDYAARSFDVVAHDQRGLGRTTIPAGPATMQEYAQDAIGLLDALGWDSCRAIGISFGGMVAQEFAVTVPD